ncbi:hypothetical protein [Thermomonospora umbrina]|uniref:hypothetical protein n=1 Tax=Thermomonospora umbrina TaxID=111806 RepID=UPI0011C19129|nr:hypothetical protein [Thermomonospora umbrina]
MSRLSCAGSGGPDGAAEAVPVRAVAATANVAIAARQRLAVLFTGFVVLLKWSIKLASLFGGDHDGRRQRNDQGRRAAIDQITKKHLYLYGVLSGFVRAPPGSLDRLDGDRRRWPVGPAAGA